MSNLLKITKNILQRIFKKRSSIIVHILLPTIVILVISALFSYGSDGLYRAAVVDLSQSESSEYLLNEIESTGKFQVVHITEEEAEQNIAEGTSSFVLIIPEDFEDKIVNGEVPQVNMMSLKESEGAAWMQATLNMQIDNMVDASYGASGDKATYISMLENLSDSHLKLETKMVDDYSNDLSASQQMFGMYLMFVLMSASSTAFLILEEKRKGTFSRVQTAPVRPRTYTLSNVLSNMIILTIQMILVLGLMKYAIKINFHTSIAQLFLILFAYIMCSVGFGVLVASATRKQGRANAVLYLILTPSCMISGCFWPVEFMPEVLRKVSFITPQRWALDAINIAQKGQNILLPVLILFAYAMLLFIASAYFIKYKEKN